MLLAADRREARKAIYQEIGEGGSCRRKTSTGLPATVRITTAVPYAPFPRCLRDCRDILLSVHRRRGYARIRQGVGSE